MDADHHIHNFRHPRPTNWNGGGARTSVAGTTGQRTAHERERALIMGTGADSRLAERLKSLALGTKRDYSAGHERPLGGYLAAMAGFGTYTAAWATLVRLRGRPLPDRPEPWDVVLTAVATFRLSRLISKASVTSPLRAPFTRYVGQLVTCPFCMSVWVAATLTGSQLLWPRATRTAMGALTALAGADALQLAYAALTDKATGGK
jgi:hypothetical protein